MNTQQTICRLIKELNIAYQPSKQKYIMDTIDLIKKSLDKEDEYKKLEERVVQLEEHVSFSKLNQQ